MITHFIARLPHRRGDALSDERLAQVGDLLALMLHNHCHMFTVR